MAAWLDRPRGWIPPAKKQAPPPAEPAGEPVEEIVIYWLLRCPACHSPDTIVTSTREAIRHHKCRACGRCFKSVER